MLFVFDLDVSLPIVLVLKEILAKGTLEGSGVHVDGEGVAANAIFMRHRKVAQATLPPSLR